MGIWMEATMERTEWEITKFIYQLPFDQLTELGPGGRFRAQMMTLLAIPKKDLDWDGVNGYQPIR
jgi:hypothetical protein